MRTRKKIKSLSQSCCPSFICGFVPRKAADTVVRKQSEETPDVLPFTPRESWMEIDFTVSAKSSVPPEGLSLGQTN